MVLTLHNTRCLEKRVTLQNHINCTQFSSVDDVCEKLFKEKLEVEKRNSRITDIITLIKSIEETCRKPKLFPLMGPSSLTNIYSI